VEILELQGFPLPGGGKYSRELAAEVAGRRTDGES
jgi:hypothetical protein